MATGERAGPVERGAAWLIGSQRADGGWEEPWFTGTGFPRNFCLDCHLYRLNFSIMALGRFLREEGA